MAIKNLSLQTIGLHVGLKDYSKTTSQQVPYKKTGVLTCSGISIFGDCSSISGKAAVTIGPPDSGTKLPFTDSLHVQGNSSFVGDAKEDLLLDLELLIVYHPNHLILNIQQKEVDGDFAMFR